MHTRFRVGTLGLMTAIAVSFAGCSQMANLKARKEFKEANGLYQAQKYKEASLKDEEALQADPNMNKAYFFLGNSYDNLFKATRKGEAENDKFLEKAVDNYKKAAERDDDPKMKKLALEYLVAAYRALTRSATRDKPSRSCSA